MTQETKKRIWPYLLVVLVLLLGIGVQLMLAVYTQAASIDRAEETARLLSARADRALRTRQDKLAEEERLLTGAGAGALSAKEQAARDEDILVLVNAWNPVPEDYQVRLVDIGDNQSFDERGAGALQEMLQACRASWAQPLIISTYRTQQMQQELFDDKVRRVLIDGVPPEEAPAVAAQSVAVPGTSEHQLGLAVDIIDESYPYLTSLQETTDTQIWLMEHCWEYGFILRYPNGTTDITGIIYEPWHYRYVGRDTAEKIRELGVTLEEYLELRRVSNS